MCYQCDIKRSAMDRHRQAEFGELTLTLFVNSPEAGETEAAEFTTDWCGSKTRSTTSGTLQGDQNAGAWEFEIWADDSWNINQAFMKRIVALKIDNRRWRVKKVEEPFANHKYWRLMATVQS